ncbi:Mitogen-activated protein kinase kinase kinase [Aphelenchoides fujianensis]|nr:Mitogen-activated protein kinase kinase kinase [Aphelenchoides fujianensis]
MSCASKETVVAAAVGAAVEAAAAVASTSTARPPFKTGLSDPTRWNATQRPLQAVVVMDRKTPKYSKQREMACADIEKVAASLSVKCKHIDFNRLDFAETTALDAFYNADIALVDFTITQQQPSLCYHIAVRESMNQKYNIIVMYAYDENAEHRTVAALSKGRTQEHPAAQPDLLVYFQSPDGGKLLSTEPFSADRTMMERFEPRNERYPKLTKKGRTVCTFADRVYKVLANVRIEADAHSREKFLSDLRKVRKIEDVNEANQFLERMRTRLDNPDVLSVDTVHQMLLSYRDTQNYDAMINLVEELERVNQHHVVKSQVVRYLYAFALNRRNAPGDRDKALENILQLLEMNKDNISPDVICLAGRVYKDKFIHSNYEDREALDQAIEWYRKAFNISPLEYSGINLTTLLRARGEQFEHNEEMQQIAVVLNSLLGRKGALTTQKDYWDVATFFEVSVLAEDYLKACQAAQKMATLKPPTWFLKSTMENIKLISRCAATISPIEKEKQMFVFWTEFFMEAIEGQNSTSTRIPVLIQEINKQFTPSYLTVNPKDVILTHVLETSQKKSPPPGIHRWEFKSSNIKAVSSSKRDDRSMYLYVYENSDDFNITFPSPSHCARVLNLMDQLGDDNKSKLLHSAEVDSNLAFEYELDNNNERVVLGAGTYGIVYSARDLTTQRSIVVKEIEVKNEEEVQPLMEEIQLHSTLSHDNIVQYLGSKRLAGLNPATDTFKGTLQYMAPEVIDHGQRGYGAPADIWSFGCTMIEMATGKPPFVELGLPQAAMFKVGMYKTHPPIPEHLTETAKKFIKSCFEPDANKRATAKQLLHDPFLTQYHPVSRSSSSKKRIESSKHANNKFHRSASHMSGMSISTAIQQQQQHQYSTATHQQSHRGAGRTVEEAPLAEYAAHTHRPTDTNTLHAGGYQFGRSNSARQHRTESDSAATAAAANGPSADFLAELALRAGAGGKDQKLHAERLIRAGERQNLRLKIERPVSMNLEDLPGGATTAPVQGTQPSPQHLQPYAMPMNGSGGYFPPHGQHTAGARQPPASASPSFGQSNAAKTTSGFFDPVLCGAASAVQVDHGGRADAATLQQQAASQQAHHLHHQQQQLQFLQQHHPHATTIHGGRLSLSGATPTSNNTSMISQPTSPHPIHTPLTASPSLCDTSPFLQLPPSTSLSIPEESTLVNRFFTLQKDVERRTTLASLMKEHEAEIIRKWLEHLQCEVREDELRIGTEQLHDLLVGIRAFFVPKEDESLQFSLEKLQQQFAADQAAYFQLIVALYVFPNAVQPSLKMQGIKPHWMFTLDDLIRSAVQSAINILAPEQTSVLSAHQGVRHYGNPNVMGGQLGQEGGLDGEQEGLYQQAQMHSAMAAAGGNLAVQCLGGHPAAQAGGLEAAVLDQEQQQRCAELSHQHRTYAAEIRKLYEDLVQVDREYKDLLEQSLLDRRRNLDRLALGAAAGGCSSSWSGSSSRIVGGDWSVIDVPAAVGGLAVKTDGALVNGDSSAIEQNGDLNHDDDECTQLWLRSVGCDQRSIKKLLEHSYSKQDIIDFVTREELLHIGIPGGIACRIWRAVLRTRWEQQHKVHSPLST